MEVQRRDVLIGLGLTALTSSARGQNARPITRTPTLRLQQHGVPADGVRDATSLLKGALASGSIVDGGGGSYAVSGPIELGPRFAGLVNTKIVQRNPLGNSLRTLFIRGASNFVLENVTVARGGTGGEVGDIRFLGETGGVFLIDCSNFQVRGMEVSGGGIGSGIHCIRCTGFTLDDVRVHDIQYRLPAHPDDDAIVGILFTRSKNFTAKGVSVHDLGGSDGRTRTNNNNRGIGITGCDTYNIIAPQISRVGQGIDTTGGWGNAHFTIVDATVMDCFSWGIKFASSASDGQIRRCTARRTGYGGFRIGGPHKQMPWRPQRLHFQDCRAEEVLAGIGHSFGFGISVSKIDSGYPRDILFERCTAVSRDPRHRMMFGFYNTARPDIAHRNRVVECHAEGYGKAAFFGFS